MKKKTFTQFAETLIYQLHCVGRHRTAETYHTALRSFTRHLNGREVHFADINADQLIAYEAHLRNRGICPNTTSFYMRNLRAIYNRAVDLGIVNPSRPFRHVYTGIDRTTKRAITLRTLRAIAALDLSNSPKQQFARDIFLFSFYTRGMSFVDIAYLRKSDLMRGTLTYRRRKTHQQLTIRWEPCMQSIVERYTSPQSPYLLPIIDPTIALDPRQQYIYVAHSINRSLKAIGMRLSLAMPLTMYVSRHTWASIARSQNVPLSIISEGMGHDSEATTRIYLSTLDTIVIDRANRKILKLLTPNP